MSHLRVKYHFRDRGVAVAATRPIVADAAAGTNIFPSSALHNIVYIT